VLPGRVLTPTRPVAYFSASEPEDDRGLRRLSKSHRQRRAEATMCSLVGSPIRLLTARGVLIPALGTWANGMFTRMT
jgi:hypothetical protein